MKNEKDTISSIKSGNKTVYKKIYLKYYGRLCLFVLNFTNDRHTAEDIVQEVFLKLWAKRKSLRLEGSLNAYLHRLAYTGFVDQYRKNKRQNEELEAFRLECLRALSVENEEYFRQRLKMAQKAIEELPPRRKEIFILCKQKGMSYNEIAMKMGISRKTVENQMGRALSEIRKKMNAELVAVLFWFWKPFARCSTHAQ